MLQPKKLKGSISCCERIYTDFVDNIQEEELVSCSVGSSWALSTRRTCASWSTRPQGGGTGAACCSTAGPPQRAAGGSAGALQTHVMEKELRMFVVVPCGDGGGDGFSLAQLPGREEKALNMLQVPV